MYSIASTRDPCMGLMSCLGHGAGFALSPGEYVPSTGLPILQGEEAMHDAIRDRQLRLGTARAIARALQRHGRVNEEVR